MKRISGTGIVLIFILAINFLIRVPFFNDVGIFDEDVYFDPTERSYTSHLTPFVDWEGGHRVPVTYYIPVLLYKVFGPSRILPRVVTGVYSCLALLFTYLLGARLYSKRAGLYAVILLFFIPVFMTQSFLYTDGIPITALALAAYYFYFKRMWVGYGLCAVLLVLSKETASLFLILLVVYDWFASGRNNPFIRRGIRLFFLLLPIQALLFWMLLTKIYLGFYVAENNSSILISGLFRDTYNLEVWIDHAQKILFPMWLQPIIWIIFWASLFSFRGSKLRSVVLTGKNILLVSPILVYFILYNVISNASFTVRYFVCTYPFLILVFANILTSLHTQSRKVQTVLVIFFCFWFTGWHVFTVFGTGSFDADGDLSVFLWRSQHRAVMNYVLQNHPNAALVNEWPWRRYWDTPIMGYVTVPGRTISHEKILSNKDQVISDMKRWGKTEIICIAVNGNILSHCPKLPDFIRIKEVALPLPMFQNRGDIIYQWIPEELQ